MNKLEYYKNRLRRVTGQETLESAGALETPLDLSDQEVKEQRDRGRENLQRLIREELAPEGGNLAAILEIVAEQLMERGERAIKILRQDDISELNNPILLDGLEGIVRTDGSRPSFSIVNDEVNTSSSPLGDWVGNLTVSKDRLKDALACVGRIDTPKSRHKLAWTGTASLIGPNLIMTNRHVLQITADFENDGEWKVSENAAIDFGYEIRGRNSVNRRKIKRVAFAPEKAIDLRDGIPVDHTALDLALFELEPGDPQTAPRTPFIFEEAKDWSDPGLEIYVIGYPGDPAGYDGQHSLLEMLFKHKYGYKRLAPGEIMEAPFPLSDKSRAHDATTLKGNSGSAVLVVGREAVVAGLHYGGHTASPLANYTHVLGFALDIPDHRSGKPLREILAEYDVSSIDSLA